LARTMSPVKSLIAESGKDNYRALLDLIDKIRAASVEISDLPVPVFVCGGDQSHGKTSLVESVSGVRMPQGSGLKTKMPTMLMMRRADEEKATVWRHSKSDETRTVPVADIAKALEELSDEVLGSSEGKSISKERLYVHVEGPKLENLSIMDLPGILHFYAEDATIEDIKELYEQEFACKDTTILVVLLSKLDVETSACMEIARQKDGDMLRTYICLSQCDVFEKEGDLEEKRQHDSLKTKVPAEKIFCVRTRKEAESGLDITAIHAAESEFFAHSNAAKDVPESNKGVPALVSALSTKQKQILQDQFPTIAKAVKERYEQCCRDQEELGSICATEPECQQEFSRILDAGADALSLQLRCAEQGDGSAPDTIETKAVAEITEDTSVFDVKVRFDGERVRLEPSHLDGSPSVCCALYSDDSLVASATINSGSAASTGTLAPCDASSFLTLKKAAQPGSGADAQASMLACVTDCMASFRSRARAVGLEFIFTDATLDELKRETKHVRGGLCLPGARMPLPEVVLARNRLRRLEPLARELLKELHGAVEQKMTEAFLNPLRHYPRIAPALKTALAVLLAERLSVAQERIAEIFEAEKHPVCVSSALAAEKMTVEEEIARMTSPIKDDVQSLLFRFWDAARLSTLIKDENDMLGGLVTTYCYCKVAHSRIVEVVTSLARLHLVTRTVASVKDHLRQAAFEFVDTQEGWLAAMETDEARRMRLQTLKKQSEKLAELLDDCNKLAGCSVY